MSIESSFENPANRILAKSDGQSINDQAFNLMMEASSLRQKESVQVSALDTPEQKAERELLESIATLVDGKGDNKTAIAVLLSQLPEKSTLSPFENPIGDKLKALGSDKSVSFVEEGNRRIMKVYRDEKLEPEKKDKSSIKHHLLYEVSAPFKR